MRKILGRIGIAALAALSLSLMTGCAGDADAETQTRRGGSTTLTGAGATFAMPLISVWSPEYQRATGSRVNYNSIGSGGGIRAHIDRTVHFAASEAPLNEEQTERAQGTLTLPFTIGTVTVAYNLPGVDDLRLTGEVLADIYLNEIRRWNHPRIAELNPGVDLPDRGIVVAHRSDGSGTTYVFTDYLSKMSERWQDRVGFATSVSWPTGIGGNGNEGVAGAIQNNPGAIGYIELSYASALGLPVAAMRNREGNFVKPTLEGATAAAAGAIDALPQSHEVWTDVSFTDAPGAESYPISSFSYFFVYEDLSRLGDQIDVAAARQIVDWLHWTVTEGQEFNAQVNNAHIPAAVRDRNVEGLRRVNFRGERLLDG